MHIFRIAAVTTRWLGVAVLLAAVGCSDEPDLPPEVEAIARERAEEEQRALEEAAQRRRDRARTIPPSDVQGSPTNALPAIGNDAPGAASTDNGAGVDGAGVDGAGVDGAGNATAGDTEARDDVGQQSDAIGDELPPRPTPPALPRDREVALKWAEMKAGMTPPDVVKLLGRPTRTADDFFLTYWYYGQGRDAGKVAFIRASQKTMAWDLPLH